MGPRFHILRYATSYDPSVDGAAKLRYRAVEKPFNDPCNYHARVGTMEFSRDPLRVRV
jgi:hypothetical protein